MGVQHLPPPFRLILSLGFAFLFSFQAHATHNRAGEITIVQTGDLTIEATITTYTKASSEQADEDSLEIFWGDGSSIIIPRVNGDGNGVVLENDVQYNIYVGTHTYAGRATYNISMRSPNRNDGILNINNGVNTLQFAFYLETEFSFPNPQFQGYNNSPLLLQPPVDIGFVGQPFIHNPNAFDQEGDSLAYELIVPRGDANQPVPNYVLPDLVIPGPDNQVSLDPLTGDFVWDSPQKEGEYNVAILIKEYRNGQLISTIVRDMQILIQAGNNMPPEIDAIDEICVIAGETVEFDVVATDPDLPQQLVELTALGGPFNLSPNPAVFTAPTGYQGQPVQGQFIWTPPCEVISDQYYSVVFKARDNFLLTDGLSTLKTVRIKVVGPKPEDLQAETNNGVVRLDWESPYACEATATDYFKGFSVWRRNSSLDVPLDTCSPGLDGYELLTVNHLDQANGRYAYQDTEVERGRSYCYRVLAEFAQTSEGGFSYNRVQSLRSEEVCVQLPRDVPLITHASVQSTDNSTGGIYVAWSKPLAEDLDTLQNPGPYTYQLLRGTGFPDTDLQPVPGAAFISPTYWQANDTTFSDTGLNTFGNAYTYQVAFYVNGEFNTDNEPLGSTVAASSVYLSVASTDELNVLTWQEDVPWSNTEYHIFRKNANTGVFDSIGTSSTPIYRDEPLVNGTEYCYYVRSVGSYSIPDIIDPIINLSQEACGTPLDTLPPCPPTLAVENICDIADGNTTQDAIENNLTWTNPANNCPGSEDTHQYNVYYAPDSTSTLTLTATLDIPEDTTWANIPNPNSVAGCYAVTALDSLGNESAYSNIVCVDNCPLYVLPNVFTPNGDGDNDLFVPFPYRFIDRIDLRIYDRWGGLVFETQDPGINWDGTNLKGEQLSESTYYYICNVFEIRADGVMRMVGEPLNGFVHLFR